MLSADQKDTAQRARDAHPVGGELFVRERAAKFRLFLQCDGRRHILPGVHVMRAQPFGIVEQKYEIFIQVGPHEGHEIRPFRRALKPVDKGQKIFFVSLLDVHQIGKDELVAADIVIPVNGIKLKSLSVKIAESGGIQPVEKGVRSQCAAIFSS